MNPRPPRKNYTIEGDLQPIMEGKAELPNVLIVPDDQLKRTLSNLTLGGLVCTPGAGWVKLPMKISKDWARYFLRTDQGGGFDGGGYVIIYPGVLATFAICKHEKVEGPGANHSRGWHPGWCGKCGYDMTVDSGD